MTWKYEQNMGLNMYKEFDHNCLASSPEVSAVQRNLKTEQAQMKSKTQAEHHTEARGMAAQPAGP